MNYEALLEKGLELHIADDRHLFARVIVSYSTFHKILLVLYRSSQGAGRQGFIGIYQDEFVYFDSLTWRSVPGKERLRIPIFDVEVLSLKKKLFNYRFVIRTPQRKYKFYSRKKDIDIIKEMKKTIEQKKLSV